MLLSRRHFFFGSLSLPALAATKPAPRPNIILVVADQLPAWLLGCYGNTEVRTPNIDRFAQTGAHFTHHVVAAPAVDAGRTSLFTGQTPMQSGASDLEKLLTGAGYACHAADAAGAAAILDAQTAGKPFFVNIRCKGLRVSEPPAQKYRDLYTQAKFENFGREAVAATATSGKEMFADTLAHQRLAAAAVTALDDEMKAIVARIYERRLAEQALVIFTAASGALLGRHGIWGAGDSSEPANMYEEAVTTPLIWTWLGRVPAQAVRPELLSSYDLLPTIADVLDLPAPGGNLCGRSYELIAEGKPLPKKTKWRSTVFGRLGSTSMARNDRYKLIVRDQGKGPGELYDLSTDAGERNNQYANDQFVTVRNGLTTELNQWMQTYSK